MPLDSSAFFRSKLRATWDVEGVASASTCGGGGGGFFFNSSQSHKSFRKKTGRKKKSPESLPFISLLLSVFLAILQLSYVISGIWPFN